MGPVPFKISLAFTSGWRSRSKQPQCSELAVLSSAAGVANELAMVSGVTLIGSQGENALSHSILSKTFEHPRTGGGSPERTGG